MCVKRRYLCSVALVLSLVAHGAAPVFAEVSKDVAAAELENAAPVARSPKNFDSAFEAWRAKARKDGFSSVEEALLLKAASADDQNAILNLAEFYCASGLYPEAIAVMRKLDGEDRAPALAFLEGIASYKMGRWSDAAALFSQATLNDYADASVWRGMALAKLGAFELAANDLLSSNSARASVDGQPVDYYLVQAEVALFLNDTAAASEALAHLDNRLELDEWRDERRLLEARMLYAKGAKAAANDLLRVLTQSNDQSTAMRAESDWLRLNVASGEMTKTEALEKLALLAMRWSGGAAERERLELEIALHEASRDLVGAAQSRRQLFVRFPQSDAAQTERKKMQAALPAILSHDRISPRDAARIFYENIDLAPPGEEGDTLIRSAVRTLVNLDLLREASELLRHQVFNRLRGEERSNVAAELAEIYLALEEPASAINALENTLRAGLPEEVVARRAFLEASAYEKTGDIDRALRLVSGREDFPSLSMSGRILSARGDFGDAGAAFGAAAGLGEGVLSAQQADAAVLAASAYMRIGDRDSLRALNAQLGERMAPGPRKDMFLSIVSDELTNSADDFQQRYNAYFSG